ncbi:MAG: glycosyltransferase family 4 protein [Pirellulaceae bacterium]|nr:glycosyltransferase family 4 protein [Pirellulaceae bacterium]
MPVPLKIAYLTAGAAGMICGSCLHDNTLARALLALGHDVQLVPLYTPIRTDEEDVTSSRVYFGGINMYLQQKSALFRWLPRWLDRWLDQGWLINWAAGGSVKIDPQQVADLTLSILRGTDGNQRKEVERLADWLTGDLRPEVIVLTNVLVAGCVPEIKRRLDLPVVVTLQGDDIFLRGLPQPHQSQALAEIRRLVPQIDGFIANTRFYADQMSDYLGIPRERIEIVPLGVDVKDFRQGKREGERGRGGEEGKELVSMSPTLPLAPSPSLPTIGYLARLAPEKGLHILAEAFLLLRKMPGMENVKLRIGGWMGEANRKYAEGVFDKLRSGGAGAAFEYLGEVDRQGKLALLRSVDVLSVPTTYREPKGLFVLEALAAGVPVVQPAHGAFPEVLAEVGGGLLHRPEDPQHLAEQLATVLADLPKLRELGRVGQLAVHAERNQQKMAERTAEVLGRVVAQRKTPPEIPTASSAGNRT